MSDIIIPSGHTVRNSYISTLFASLTVDPTGKPNGSIANLVNPNLGEEHKIGQVYITLCEVDCRKGPHMHEGTKEDRFWCVFGRAKIICRNEQTKEVSSYLLESCDNQLLIIPPYNSHAIIALDDLPCIVLSIPTEGYNPVEKYNQVETFYGVEEWGD